MSKQFILSSKRELEVIEYPGIVKNVDKMYATLGGITKISQALGGEQKRMELRFHYENPYSKGAYGEGVPSCGLLLAIKVRRCKNKIRPPEYDVRVMGHCNQVFTFKNLCDFQYLPLWREPSLSQSLFTVDQLKPKSPLDIDYFSRTEVPLFSLPTSFARSDTIAPSSGIFRYDAKNDTNSEILATTPKIALETQDCITFNMVDPFPVQPDLQILKRMRVKYVSDEQFQRVKKLFEECPIWTRIALLYESGISNEKLKCIVPSLAFYFSTGPWRMLYVRYGYDPRKHFESRHYQTFDFRMRYRSGVSEFVAVRSQLLRKQNDNNEEGKAGALVQDVNYPYFDEHKLPRSRQCIMRYCDLYVSKVQEMLEKIPSPLAGATCNEKTGWLPVGFDAQVRQIVCNAVRDLLRAHNRKEERSEELEYDENEDEMEEEELELQSDAETCETTEQIDINESLGDIIEEMQMD